MLIFIFFGYALCTTAPSYTGNDDIKIDNYMEPNIFSDEPYNSYKNNYYI